jgi:hypothetical protein
VAGGEESRETSSDDQACGGRKEAARPGHSHLQQHKWVDLMSTVKNGLVGSDSGFGGWAQPKFKKRSPSRVSR